MSSSSIALAIAVTALAWPLAARAQHCHLDAPAPTATAAPPLAVTISLRWTAGAAEVATRDVAYQGADLAVEARWRRLSAGARLGAYHVDDHGVGADDLSLAASVRLTPTAALVAVHALAGATLPTGDADAGRGMGHVMVAGGVGADAHRGRVRGALAVIYARTLGDGATHTGHVHGAALAPLIDPMAAVEVTVDAGVTVAVGPRGMAVRGAVLAGEPIEAGARRVIGSGGVELVRGRYLISATVSAPVVGTAFIARGQVAVAYRY